MILARNGKNSTEAIEATALEAGFNLDTLTDYETVNQTDCPTCPLLQYAALGVLYEAQIMFASTE